MTHGVVSYRIRKLWPLDFPAFRRHLLRLDPETRQQRFSAAVNDAFLEAYADTAKRIGTVTYGAFHGYEMHASAELRPLDVPGESMAEAAFAVERDCQHHGLGSLLMDRIITAAQNRSIGQLYMICMRDNATMQHLAGKFGAQMKVEQGEVTGQIETAWPTPASLLDEQLNDATGFITAVLDWRPATA